MKLNHGGTEARSKQKTKTLSCFLCASVPPWLILFVSCAFAVDIEGVQPAALDQPRVNMHLRREPKGKPLSTKKLAGEETINIQAFCDTGASGVMLSKTTADALGVARAKAGGDD